MFSISMAGCCKECDEGMKTSCNMLLIKTEQLTFEESAKIYVQRYNELSETYNKHGSKLTLPSEKFLPRKEILSFHLAKPNPSEIEELKKKWEKYEFKEGPDFWEAIPPPGSDELPKQFCMIIAQLKAAPIVNFGSPGLNN